jgi:hypothetical protein
MDSRASSRPESRASQYSSVSASIRHQSTEQLLSYITKSNNTIVSGRWRDSTLHLTTAAGLALLLPSAGNRCKGICPLSQLQLRLFPCISTTPDDYKCIAKHACDINCTAAAGCHRQSVLAQASYCTAPTTQSPSILCLSCRNCFRRSCTTHRSLPFNSAASMRLSALRGTRSLLSCRGSRGTQQLIQLLKQQLYMLNCGPPAAVLVESQQCNVSS